LTIPRSIVPSAHPAAHDHSARLLVKRFLRRLREAGFLLPATLTAGLWLKGWHPWLPGLSCPLRRLTGVPCPTCFLTRATSAALTGDWPTAVRLHAFGPVVAIALVWWSILAIRQRRLVPRQLPAWPLGWGAAALVAYWLLRLVVSYGLGMRDFPAFPSG
jgi:hypothetical protein